MYVVISHPVSVVVLHIHGFLCHQAISIPGIHCAEWTYVTEEFTIIPVYTHVRVAYVLVTNWMAFAGPRRVVNRQNHLK